MVGLDMETAMAAYAPDRTVDLVGVYAEDGVSQTELATSVKATLAGVPGMDVEVLTGDQMRADSHEQWQSMLGFISTFLLVFAGIALFVGTFIISNTFAMVVRQRQREFAMLRAVGASPSQVFASVLGQAAVIGVVGAHGRASRWRTAAGAVLLAGGLVAVAGRPPVSSRTTGRACWVSGPERS